MEHAAIGHWGENLACVYLCGKGYRIVDRNLRISHDEIDIIAYTPQRDLAFIEVKTRFSLNAGPAAEHISAKKLTAMRRAALAYAFEKGISEAHLCLEAVAIDVSRLKKMAKIRHFKNLI